MEQKIDEDGNKRWYINGKLHREDGPAVELEFGIKWWYKDKNIQRLRKKILDLFFYYDKKPVKLWNEKIKDIYYEKF